MNTDTLVHVIAVPFSRSHYRSATSLGITRHRLEESYLRRHPCTARTTSPQLHSKNRNSQPTPCRGKAGFEVWILPKARGV